jgi:hypothetical protein
LQNFIFEKITRNGKQKKPFTGHDGNANTCTREIILNCVDRRVKDAQKAILSSCNKLQL